MGRRDVPTLSSRGKGLRAPAAPTAPGRRGGGRPLPGTASEGGCHRMGSRNPEVTTVTTARRRACRAARKSTPVASLLLGAPQAPGSATPDPCTLRLCPLCSSSWPRGSARLCPLPGARAPGDLPRGAFSEHPRETPPLLSLSSDQTWVCTCVHAHMSAGGPSPPGRTPRKGRVLSQFCHCSALGPTAVAGSWDTQHEGRLETTRGRSLICISRQAPGLEKLSRLSAEEAAEPDPNPRACSELRLCSGF